MSPTSSLNCTFASGSAFANFAYLILYGYQMGFLVPSTGGLM